jgi:hypothetical protein
MKINEILTGFSIYTTREEDSLLKKLGSVAYLSSFNEHDQFIIEGLIRKSLVIKIGDTNPKVIANEFETPI